MGYNVTVIAFLSYNVAVITFSSDISFSWVYLCWATMLQTTLAALSSHSSSQIVPHVLLIWTSTRPFILLVPFTNRTGILATIAVREEKVQLHLWLYHEAFLTAAYLFLIWIFPIIKTLTLSHYLRDWHLLTYLVRNKVTIYWLTCITIYTNIFIVHTVLIPPRFNLTVQQWILITRTRHIIQPYGSISLSKISWCPGNHKVVTELIIPAL